MEIKIQIALLKVIKRVLRKIAKEVYISEENNTFYASERIYTACSLLASAIQDLGGKV